MSARTRPAPPDWERAEATVEPLPETDTPAEETADVERLLSLLAQAQRTLRQGYGQRI